MAPPTSGRVCGPSHIGTVTLRTRLSPKKAETCGPAHSSPSAPFSTISEVSRTFGSSLFRARSPAPSRSRGSEPGVDLDSSPVVDSRSGALSLLGLPTPTPFTNAVQLLLTLKLVSLASEVQDLHLAQRKEMASGFSKGPTLGLLPDVPSLMETLSYSYCYVGIMTAYGEHREERKELQSAFPQGLGLQLGEQPINDGSPPIIRAHQGFVWAICQCWGCRHDPEKAASLEYDYETIRNIDCYGTDFCVRVRDGMRYWNMTETYRLLRLLELGAWV
ncbi:PREDICTED: lysophospholipid acyltransferase 7 [Mandrillus leucophaeus]|uniref:lysophospholipid acyltransferase 7 n=1 Tax=Mandrillus leucophaeus TaxID=9568 RepID=UPI0005F47C94|nr:PREDICTED: lysophospholipid acyltransferase 7 [Mandrillus leucophaeus]